MAASCSVRSDVSQVVHRKIHDARFGSETSIKEVAAMTSEFASEGKAHLALLHAWMVKADASLDEDRFGFDLVKLSN